MILRATIIPVLALLVALSTVTVLFYAGVAHAPAAFLGDETSLLLTPPGGALTSQGTLSASLADVLAEEPAVRATSPEIFVPTSIGGASVMARGVDAARFFAITHARIVEGHQAIGANEALVGARFVAEHGTHLNDTIPLAGSLERAIAYVRVVGVYEARAPVDDEIMISLSLARELSGLSGDGVHLIRIDAIDRTAISALTESIAPAFTYANVHLNEDQAVIGDHAELHADVINWGLVGGTRSIIMTVDGQRISVAPVYVGARSIQTVVVPFLIDHNGVLNVTLDRSLYLTVFPVTADIEMPRVLTVDEPVRLHVRNASGDVAGAEIQAGLERSITDASGNATLTPRALGALPVKVFVRGDVIAGIRAFVVPPGYERTGKAYVVSLRTPASYVRSNETVRVDVEIANVGGTSADVGANVSVDGRPVARASHPLEPGASTNVSVELSALPAGAHELGIEGSDESATVVSVDGDPALAAIIHARRSAAAPDLDVGAQDYISRVVGDVRIAVIALSALSAGLAGLGAAAAITRHVAERGPALGLLKALGADREYVLRIVTREAALWAGVASAIGVLVGCAFAVALDAGAGLRAFGHAVRPSFDITVLLALAAGATTLIALVARGIAASAFARPLDQLMRGEMLRARAREAPRISVLAEGA